MPPVRTPVLTSLIRVQVHVRSIRLRTCFSNSAKFTESVRPDHLRSRVRKAHFFHFCVIRVTEASAVHISPLQRNSQQHSTHPGAGGPVVHEVDGQILRRLCTFLNFCVVRRTDDDDDDDDDDGWMDDDDDADADADDDDDDDEDDDF